MAADRHLDPQVNPTADKHIGFSADQNIIMDNFILTGEVPLGVKTVEFQEVAETLGKKVSGRDVLREAIRLRDAISARESIEVNPEVIADIRDYRKPINGRGLMTVSQPTLTLIQNRLGLSDEEVAVLTTAEIIDKVSALVPQDLLPEDAPGKNPEGKITAITSRLKRLTQNKVAGAALIMAAAVGGGQAAAHFADEGQSNSDNEPAVTIQLKRDANSNQSLRASQSEVKVPNRVQTQKEVVSRLTANDYAEIARVSGASDLQHIGDTVRVNDKVKQVLKSRGVVTNLGEVVIKEGNGFTQQLKAELEQEAEVQLVSVSEAAEEASSANKNADSGSNQRIVNIVEDQNQAVTSNWEGGEPTPRPKPTKTPKPTETPTVKPTKTPYPTKTPTATKTPRPTMTPTPDATKTPTPAPVPQPGVVDVPEPTRTPTPTPTPEIEILVPPRVPRPETTLVVGKFIDIDGDGRYDVGEPGTKARFSVDGPGRNDFSLDTDFAGNAAVPVIPGTYIICEDKPEHWDVTTEGIPTMPECQIIVLAEGKTGAALFGNRIKPTIEPPMPPITGLSQGDSFEAKRILSLKEVETKDRIVGLQVMRGETVIVGGNVDLAQFGPTRVVIKGKQHELNTWNVPLDGDFGQLNGGGTATEDEQDQVAIHDRIDTGVSPIGEVIKATELKNIVSGDRLIKKLADGREVVQTVRFAGEADPRQFFSPDRDSTIITTCTNESDVENPVRFVVYAETIDAADLTSKIEPGLGLFAQAEVQKDSDEVEINQIKAKIAEITGEKTPQVEANDRISAIGVLRSSSLVSQTRNYVKAAFAGMALMAVAMYAMRERNNKKAVNFLNNQKDEEDEYMTRFRVNK